MSPSQIVETISEVGQMDFFSVLIEGRNDKGYDMDTRAPRKFLKLGSDETGY